MKTQLLSLLVITSGITFGQVTITGNDVNPMVATGTHTQNSSNYINPGTAGANQTWDLTGLTSTGVSTSTISVSSTNGSNMEVNSNGTSIHLLLDNSAYEIKQIETGGLTFAYSDGEKLYQFPMSLGTSNTDSFYATFTSNGFPGIRSGNTTCEMDGYGTLMIPGQTISDVARVKVTQVYSDSIDVLGSWTVVDYVSELYTWFKAGHENAVASMTSFTVFGTGTEAGTYTTTTNVGIVEATDFNGIKILGNPVKELLRFNVNGINETEATYEIVDIMGKNIYASNTIMIKPGVNVFQVPVDHLSTGYYALRISNSSGIQSSIVVKE